MTGGIEVDPERVASRFAWLNLVSGSAEREYLRLDGFDVVNSEIEVQLLRSVSGGPTGWHEACWKATRRPSTTSVTQIIVTTDRDATYVLDEILGSRPRFATSKPRG